jgi:hypothetical protein
LLPFNPSLVYGTGDGQAANMWHDHRTLATGANDDIYLNGNPAFANRFGQPLALTNIKVLYLHMTTGAAGKTLTLGGHPTAPWAWEIGAAANTRDFRDFIFEGNTHDGWTVGGALAAPTIPAVAASGSGATIPTGTYYVKITYINPAGESVGSVVSAGQAITLGQDLVVTSPAAEGNATAYSVYVGTAVGGPFVLQGTTTALASNATLASLVNFGPTPPLVSGAYANSILRIANASGVSMQYDVALWGSP